MKRIDKLKKACTNAIMEKNFTPDHLKVVIADEFKPDKRKNSDLTLKESLYSYIDYLSTEAKDIADWMWAINSITYYLEFEYEGIQSC